MRAVSITEFTDPGSVWAWGSEPKLRLLEWRYGDQVEWRRVMGGMAEDEQSHPLATGARLDPANDAPAAVEVWRSVHGVTGMPFPSELRTVFASTRLACLAVKAAQVQGDDVGARVLRRLREWTFVVGERFDTTVAVVAAISGVPGLDVDDYVAALSDPQTMIAYQEDWEATRRPNAQARQVEDDHPGHGRVRADGNRFRYAFPTLVLEGPGGVETVAGWKPIEDYVAALGRAAGGEVLTARPDPTTDEVIARWGTAADVELAVLAGSRGSDPSDVVAHEWGGGVFFLTRAEARSLGLAGASG
ncbi:MAG: DsbA family protein [Actinomycetota bacterium]